MQTIASPFLQGYVGMSTLIAAIEAAKSLEQDAVMKQLNSLTFDSPYGKVKYKTSEGGALHQLLTDENMVLIQFRPQGQEVVLPADKANGKLVYPAQ
jgi:branched-chain amino acid transport system substrate-binding protein